MNQIAITIPQVISHLSREFYICLPNVTRVDNDYYIVSENIPAEYNRNTDEAFSRVQ